MRAYVYVSWHITVSGFMWKLWLEFNNNFCFLFASLIRETLVQGRGEKSEGKLYVRMSIYVYVCVCAEWVNCANRAINRRAYRRQSTKLRQ